MPGVCGCYRPNAVERTVTESIVETGERLRSQIKEVKSLTDKPFGVNLITFEVAIDSPEG
jgi:hypothetical protein